MSLWHRSVNEITFADVEAFCQQRQREGPRLDYKREWGRDHHKLVCAFANTLGGMIVLGVDGDENSEPIWPPHGLTDSAGLAERIIQQVQDAIYPAVRPIISPLLTDPVSGKSVMVVRVDESPEAPHAVDSGTKVLVYERSDSINKPWALARVDRIEDLLNRRRKFEEKRELLIQSAIARGRRYLSSPSVALRWASIIPIYPWRKLCDPEFCYWLHHGSRRGDVQRIPDGSLVIRGSGGPASIETMTAQGHIFIMEYSSESPPHHIAEKEGINLRDYLTWRKTVEAVNTAMFLLAQAFFEHRAVQLPGLLQFDLGFLNAFGKRMMSETNRIGRPFPDSEFRAQVTFPIEGLLKNNVANEQLLFDQIRQGFDLFNDGPRYSFQPGSRLTQG